MSDFTDKLRQASRRPENWDVPSILEAAATIMDVDEPKFALFDETRSTILAAGMSAALDAKHFAEKLKLSIGVLQNANRYSEMKDLIARIDALEPPKETNP